MSGYKHQARSCPEGTVCKNCDEQMHFIVRVKSCSRWAPKRIFPQKEKFEITSTAHLLVYGRRIVKLNWYLFELVVFKKICAEHYF